MLLLPESSAIHLESELHSLYTMVVYSSERNNIPLVTYHDFLNGVLGKTEAAKLLISLICQKILRMVSIRSAAIDSTAVLCRYYSTPSSAVLGDPDIVRLIKGGLSFFMLPLLARVRLMTTVLIRGILLRRNADEIDCNGYPVTKRGEENQVPTQEMIGRDIFGGEYYWCNDSCNLLCLRLGYDITTTVVPDESPSAGSRDAEGRCSHMVDTVLCHDEAAAFEEAGALEGRAPPAMPSCAAAYSPLQGAEFLSCGRDYSVTVSRKPVSEATLSAYTAEDGEPEYTPILTRLYREVRNERVASLNSYISVLSAQPLFDRLAQACPAFQQPEQAAERVLCYYNKMMTEEDAGTFTASLAAAMQELLAEDAAPCCPPPGAGLAAVGGGAPSGVEAPKSGRLRAEILECLLARSNKYDCLRQHLDDHDITVFTLLCQDFDETNLVVSSAFDNEIQESIAAAIQAWAQGGAGAGAGAPPGAPRGSGAARKRASGDGPLLALEDLPTRTTVVLRPTVQSLHFTSREELCGFCRFLEVASLSSALCAVHSFYEHNADNAKLGPLFSPVRAEVLEQLDTTRVLIRNLLDTGGPNLDRLKDMYRGIERELTGSFGSKQVDYVRRYPYWLWLPKRLPLLDESLNPLFARLRFNQIREKAGWRAPLGSAAEGHGQAAASSRARGEHHPGEGDNNGNKQEPPHSEPQTKSPQEENDSSADSSSSESDSDGSEYEEKPGKKKSQSFNYTPSESATSESDLSFLDNIPLPKPQLEPAPERRGFVRPPGTRPATVTIAIQTDPIVRVSAAVPRTTQDEPAAPRLEDRVVQTGGGPAAVPPAAPVLEADTIFSRIFKEIEPQSSDREQKQGQDSDGSLSSLSPADESSDYVPPGMLRKGGQHNNAADADPSDFY